MGRLFKLLLFIAIIGFIALISYAYVGPFFGVDFAPEPQEVRLPVVLETD